ncbi:hypothetical protein PIB30_032752, partial [Stylosanthes scabra]|nr:hypothetical protein [Stylosanthes scabra]
MAWWERACTRQFLSADRVLQDPRSGQLPDDIPPADTQPRDSIVLPHDALVEDGLGNNALMSGGRVKGRLTAVGRTLSRVERVSTRRLSTIDRRKYPRKLRLRLSTIDRRIYPGRLRLSTMDRGHTRGGLCADSGRRPCIEYFRCLYVLHYCHHQGNEHHSCGHCLSDPKLAHSRG